MIYAIKNPVLLSLAIVGGTLLFFGLIVLIVIIVKRNVKALQIKKDDISEEEAIEQELDRILVPIEDEETAREMAKENIEEMKKEDAKKQK